MVAYYSRQTFDAEFRTLLVSGGSSAHSMIAFLLRSLAQFHLSRRFTPHEILQEAYMRGVKRIEAGEYIENPLAWVRSTSYNIIREYSRERKKFYQLDAEIVESSADYSLVRFQEIDESIERLFLAFEKLDKEEKEILRLKIVENLTWKEILVILEQKGILVGNEASLRKRKERALKHLRKIYHSLHPQNVS